MQVKVLALLLDVPTWSHTIKNLNTRCIYALDMFNFSAIENKFHTNLGGYLLQPYITENCLDGQGVLSCAWPQEHPFTMKCLFLGVLALCSYGYTKGLKRLIFFLLTICDFHNYNIFVFYYFVFSNLFLKKYFLIFLYFGLALY